MNIHFNGFCWQCTHGGLGLASNGNKKQGWQTCNSEALRQHLLLIGIDFINNYLAGKLFCNFLNAGR